MFSYYSDVLPKIPVYDFIHYRNYFLITTIIVIILQDINFVRIKLQNQQQLIKESVNSISMKKLNSKNLSDTKLTKIDNVFNESRTKIDANDDEETFFDIEQYDLKGTTHIIPNNSNNQIINDQNIKIRMELNNSFIYKINQLINQNQSRLMILFVFILILTFIYALFVLFTSITFSHFTFLSPLIHPSVIVFSFVFKKYTCKF
jgi:hypothetical protein